MVEIAGLAYDAGLRNPARIAQAVAVAWAESSGNPAAKGDLHLTDSKWGPSVGLWQIRSLKAEKGKGTTRDEDALKNPAHNAKSMMSISAGGSNWSPWSVTKPTDPVGYARYSAALLLAPPAVAQALATKGVKGAAEGAAEVVDGPIDAVRAVAGTISEAVQTPVRIANWLTEPGTWKRIAIFGAGGAMLLLGVFLIARPVVTAGANAVPVGKAAKLAGKVLK